MKLNSGAIFAGWAVAHIGEIGVNKSLYRAFGRALAHGSTDELQLEQIALQLLDSPLLHILQLVAQVVVMIAATAITLQIAERAFFPHAIIVALLSVTSTLIFWMGYWGSWPLWYSMLCVLLPVPTACLTANWSARRGQKSAPPQKLLPAIDAESPAPLVEKPKVRPKW